MYADCGKLTGDTDGESLCVVLIGELTGDTDV